jgi:ElaA protein
VFIVEQDCPYLDIDDKDIYAHHVLGKDENGVIHSYSRILAKGISYEEYSSIGRVITSSNARGSGEGRKMMKFAIECIKSVYPRDRVKISSQCYISSFYQSLGFEKVGEEYLEDNIPHIAMILKD